ncbi:cupin domain-containing protein [Kitasatospora kifunensis]|uniref:Quercetin dioxygenase-like cupin family protein n=1 Tax=Kitasatospora kifunensis TaxID=58351 RepID=A0A7W7RAD2_KITKI|nr:cupin domain-containing protein [Kitasatospora kifunensis]MBB4928279.1 quercetin dioxygenase-like cupin family protein [Kitasatospora kifunensis]
MTDTVPDLTPIHRPLTAGEAFDFGTHFNDFLVPREHAAASEVFTVRVPGGGSVPLHVHTDMEQTFVFTAGLGQALLVRGQDRREQTCRPGDVLFVPVGWHHQVAAPGPEGCVYVTINAFLPAYEAARVGQTAIEHAQIADAAFDRTTVLALQADAVAVFRCAESLYRPDAAGVRVWPQDGAALDATLTGDPDRYRVRRLGPFEFVVPVEPVGRVLDARLAEVIHRQADRLAVLVEGSQSPLSAKLPTGGSDLDLLIPVTTATELEHAHRVVERLRELTDQIPVPLSPGIVHTSWLRLPGFYSALHLDPAHPDRRWFDASPAQCQAEAVRRQQAAIALLEHPEQVRAALEESLALVGLDDAAVAQWRITPRWLGLQ